MDAFYSHSANIISSLKKAKTGGNIMSEEIYEELANAVINCKADLSKAAAQKPSKPESTPLKLSTRDWSRE